MSKANDTTMNPAEIDWTNADAKREIEGIAFRVISLDVLSMPKKVKVLSFPADDWVWETSLMGLFKHQEFHITGVERNPEVHARCLANTPPQGKCHVYVDPISFSEYLDSVPRTVYNIIYLDWMGTWSKEKKRDIQRLLSEPSRLAPGGILILTMALNRGRPESTDELREYAQNSLAFVTYDQRGRDFHTSGFRVRGIPQWVVDESIEAGVPLKPLMAGVYYSLPATSGGPPVPMVQFLFKRDD